LLFIRSGAITFPGCSEGTGGEGWGGRRRREERRERSAPFLSTSELAGSFQRVGGRCIG